jgi:hypothetical protein
MRYINLTIFLIVLICSSCGQTVNKANFIIDDRTQIKDLLIQVLKWHDKNGTYTGFEPIFNPKDSLAIGMDLKVLQNELDNLTKTNQFDKEFLDNYSLIVKTIDKKIKNKEIVFMLGDLPPFAGADPWCNCQDIPYDNPWDKIDIKFISIDKDNADLTWTWGESDWSKDFSYKVRAKKANGIWRISYLQGFDLKVMTR